MTRFLFIPVVVLLSACSKHESGTTTISLRDTVDFFRSNIYQLDADRDGTKDIRITGSAMWGTTWSDYNFTVYALNTDTKVHSLYGSQPVCKDSSFNGTIWIYNTYSCTGGPKQIRIDSFIYTPRFLKNSLSSNSVSNLPDSGIIIYRSNGGYPPGGSQSSYSYGNFFDNVTKTGWMLFSVKGKRYGLSITWAGQYLYFEELMKID